MIKVNIIKGYTGHWTDFCFDVINPSSILEFFWFVCFFVFVLFCFSFPASYKPLKKGGETFV